MPIIDTPLSAAYTITVAAGMGGKQRGEGEGIAMTPDEPGGLSEPGAGVDQEIREPKMYRVILHNDDYTTMDFVIEVLISIFHKPAADATRIMIDVHKKGKGVCGVYTYDIAATRINRVHQLARMREFPLKCSLEEA